MICSNMVVDFPHNFSKVFFITLGYTIDWPQLFLQRLKKSDSQPATVGREILTYTILSSAFIACLAADRSDNVARNPLKRPARSEVVNPRERGAGDSWCWVTPPLRAATGPGSPVLPSSLPRVELKKSMLLIAMCVRSVARFGNSEEGNQHMMIFISVYFYVLIIYTAKPQQRTWYLAGKCSHTRRKKNKPDSGRSQPPKPQKKQRFQLGSQDWKLSVELCFAR